MAKKTFKKQYKLKIIEHRTIDVEADSEEDAIAWAEGNINKYGVVRPITDSNFKTIKKILKRTAKVIDEKDSADVLYARAKRKAAYEAGQVLCTNCGKTRAKEHWYDRYSEMYYGEDGHEYHTVEGMKRWFEMNKEINKKHGFNNQTEFDKEEIERLEKLGIDITQ